MRAWRAPALAVCAALALSLAPAAPGRADGEEGAPAAPVKAAGEGGAPAAKPLPSSVDLRKRLDAWGLGPRRQGERNTCSVFTTTAALEFALSKHRGKGVVLSPEFLNWGCNQVIGNRTDDRGQFFKDLLAGFDRFGVCPEADMPYLPKFDPKCAPSDAATRAAKAVREAGLVVHWIRAWTPQQGLTDAQFDEVRRVLASGYPVAAGSNHSRLLVGYEVDPKAAGGGTFATKDSGSGRYDSVTFEFVRTKVGDAFWVEAPKVAAGR